jgi:predicted ATPase with chaperone activity
VYWILLPYNVAQNSSTPGKNRRLLLDRIDIHISVQCVEYEKLSDSRPGEKSILVQARVEVSCQIQCKRFELI